jgi:hypothetical protein
VECVVVMVSFSYKPCSKGSYERVQSGTMLCKDECKPPKAKR